MNLIHKKVILYEPSRNVTFEIVSAARNQCRQLQTSAPGSKAGMYDLNASQSLHAKRACSCAMTLRRCATRRYLGCRAAYTRVDGGDLTLEFRLGF